MAHPDEIRNGRCQYCNDLLSEPYYTKSGKEIRRHLKRNDCSESKGRHGMMNVSPVRRGGSK